MQNDIIFKGRGGIFFLSDQPGDTEKLKLGNVC